MSSHGSSSKASSSQRGAGSGNAGSDLDEGDTEEDSSSSSVQDNLNGTLSSFRIKWKQELDSISNVKSADDSGEKLQQKPKPKAQEKPKNLSIEAKAKLLFHQGVEYEKNGKYYDAIQCYKNAIQLVPDIEFKIYSESKQGRTLQTDGTSDTAGDSILDETHSSADDSNEEEEEDEYDGSENLVQRCQRLLSKHNTFILPAHAQSTTHFSALPMEIVIYILRWVMSAHHDARSLDMCAAVCRGLYICARDPGIWRAACIRTWGLECSNLTASAPSWRQLFLEQPRLETTGCYISKTSYLRHGDNSFQDRTHRPWHVVTYFRYLRFFPGNLALLLTTADPPSSVVSSLRHRTPRDTSILSGHYKLRGDTVFVVAKQSRYNMNNARVKTNRNRRVNEFESRDQTYHLELKIEPHRHRRHMTLQWQDYFIVMTNYLGVTSTTKFDTVGSKFPAYWFSRVKSYTAESDGILEVNF
uniref:F-box only protein 9 n=1 Tax=Cacopsylla melanoneura TaxID=428564 RepID=A0A8D9BMC6_9HEMI